MSENDLRTIKSGYSFSKSACFQGIKAASLIIIHFPKSALKTAGRRTLPPPLGRHGAGGALRVRELCGHQRRHVPHGAHRRREPAGARGAYEWRGLCVSHLKGQEEAP